MSDLKQNQGSHKGCPYRPQSPTTSHSSNLILYPLKHLIPTQYLVV